MFVVHRETKYMADSFFGVRKSKPGDFFDTTNLKVGSFWIPIYVVSYRFMAVR
jgi:hypothetical protein